MNPQHWLFLLAIATLTALLLAFSLNARPQTRSYRVARRVFWAAVFLHVASTFHALGFNAFNLALAATLGLPGCAALLTVALM